MCIDIKSRGVGYVSKEYYLIILSNYYFFILVRITKTKIILQPSANIRPEFALLRCSKYCNLVGSHRVKTLF